MPLLTVYIGKEIKEIVVERGANLRQVLQAAELSPYTALTRRANCGGRGICATCGVLIDVNEPAPEHWHDWLAARFGYPRLSCQISVESDMTVRILEDKIIWGPRNPKRMRS